MNMDTHGQSQVGAIDVSQFHGVFFEETDENIAAFEQGLLKLNLQAPDAEELNAIFRAAHSIKGGSGTFGFHEMAAVTHELETLLDLARRREIHLTSAMIDVLLQAGDVLRAQLSFFRGDRASVEADPEAVSLRIRELIVQGKEAFGKDTTVAEHEVDEGEKAASDDSFGFFSDFDVPGDSLGKDASKDEGYGFFDSEPELAAASTHLHEAVESAAPQRRVADRPDAPVANFGRRASDRSPTGDGNSIRVSVEKVDQLINLVGELVITQAMLVQATGKLNAGEHESLLATMTQLERNTRDLQESVMTVRMMPIAAVFNRFPRVVRDLAAKLGKEVSLSIVGESTELDKGLIEKIADPLTHLVRNSLDHGIESPAVRIAAGKPSSGTVTLRAFHQGGSIVIEVSDDGGGLHRDRILSKARERGLRVADDMPDQEVWQLIFEAGFSTAEVVTDVSGRGVGMDVVKRNIQSMGGRVEIESVQGQGTRISIRLPLTLAILEGMSVAIAKETFILPLAHVIESLAPKPEEIKSVGGQSRVVQVRGEYLPVIGLDTLFNLRSEESDREKILVVLDADGVRAALQVDALIGQHQVVIKSLESNYRKVAGISGATIMGDGHVAMILDVPALVRMSRQ